ncbi:hypothetical protein Adeg_0790 [Ammonifex degensii KC4]|uniref:Uncharacterized protein n=1 Tax=Ammonifex degensii (strain DSM 10501 / KC4) TaxID=429009 RepID=C9RCF6_AMMDK|nr:hypothetical protein [Ammonifex degensii]ACX51933.1 hypothetical protein Adeg_0790 [Ammonifex degensii KC4]
MKVLLERRGDVLELALVLGLLVSLLLVTMGLAQRVQVRAAAEAAAREAARYIAAYSVFEDGKLVVPPGVRQEAERRAREVVARNVSPAARGAGRTDPYRGITVTVDCGTAEVGSDRVKVTVKCDYTAFASLSPRGGLWGFLAPGGGASVVESCVFRVPHPIKPEEPQEAPVFG